MSTTIRVDESTRDRLAAIATATNQPMAAVIENALDALERRRFFEPFDEGYRRLREDPGEWARVEDERAVEATSD